MSKDSFVLMCNEICIVSVFPALQPSVGAGLILASPVSHKLNNSEFNLLSSVEMKTNKRKTNEGIINYMKYKLQILGLYPNYKKRCKITTTTTK